MKKLVSVLITAAIAAGAAANVFAVSDDIFSTDVETLTTGLTTMTDSECEEYINDNLDISLQDMLVLVTLTANQAYGDIDEAVTKTLDDGLSAVDIKEAIYQSAPYDGFPRTLNLISAVNDAVGNSISQTPTVITIQIGNPEMTVNGIKQEIDPGMGTVPVISNERTLLPVRAIVEALGGTVEWDENTRTASLSYDSDNIELTIDSTTAYLNGTAYTLDTTPVIINDRTMLPIRFIAESFGLEVGWDQPTQTVTVSSRVQQITPTAAPTEEMVSDNDQEENRMLVVYFSATGNTESMAETIANVTGADIYEIVPEDPYTSEDLNYSDDNCRANQEMNDESARPAIAGEIENIDEYDTIFLGYPIWWGTMPRIINTFLDTYDLSGKTIMPFCTSGSSGISTSVSAIRSICSDADVLEGMRGTSATTETQIEEWLSENGIEME